MTVSLDELIVSHRESLVDAIAKDAIRQIPSYGAAPLRRTVERVERWLDTLVASIEQNEPDILEEYLSSIAGERQEEGYAIMELHAIVSITEEHVQKVIGGSVFDEIERNGLLALLGAVMDAVKMVLSVRYVLATGN
jgi:hypothetical protein